MGKDNVVSVWIGNFESERKFYEYIEPGCDEEGDETPSGFMNAFGMDNFDPDSQEVTFQEHLSKEDLRQASYAENFVDELGDISGNCAIMLYDFLYSGTTRQADGLRFIGAFNYTK